MKILHVAAIDMLPSSGMGRISYEWKLAFEKSGHQFQHIGSNEVGHRHALLFGYYARKYAMSNSIEADLILVHEPLAGFFSFKNIPMVVFSHGVEERGWLIQRKFGFNKLSLKSRLLPEFIRFHSNNKGFRKCTIGLLSNAEDTQFLMEEKKLQPDKLKIFHNGCYPFPLTENSYANSLTVLFNATWLPRKGIQLMYDVFNSLLREHSHINLILAGTKIHEEEVRKGFVEEVQQQLTVRSSFASEDEKDLYASARIFVMPSYFEGQSVALTQAMSMGLCPVASSNCGQKDFIIHKTNGLLFETGNAKDFKHKLN